MVSTKKIKITKFRKKGYIISKSDSSRLTTQAQDRFGSSNNSKLRISGREFFYSQRKDGRIEIPARVIKRKDIKKGQINADVVPARRGDIVTRNQKFFTARHVVQQREKFFFQDLLDVNLQSLKSQVLRDVQYYLNRRTFVYVRYVFLVEEDDGTVFLFFRIMPELDSLELKNDPVTVKRMVSVFVDQVFVEMEENILTRPYVTGITFVKYSVNGGNQMRARRVSVSV